MEVSKETQEKIEQLQMFEHNLQTFSAQRQQLQGSMLELENAKTELEKATGKIYKIAGTVMVESEKNVLLEELSSQKDIAELRLKNIKKQEESIKERAEKLQSEVLAEFEASEKK